MTEFCYDPNHTLPIHCYRCPSCGCEFYGQGRVIHRPDCPTPEINFRDCTYIFGPALAEQVIRLNIGFPDREWTPSAGLTPTVLRDQFPALYNSLTTRVLGEIRAAR